MGKRTRWQRNALTGIVLAMLLLADPSVAGSSEVPDGIPGQIDRAWTQCRSDWTREAVFSRLLMERPSADQPFRSDFTFTAASRGKLYHVRLGPKGSTAGEDVYRYMPTITAQVIDLPRAVQIARRSGMKGGVLTADLSLWLPHNRTVAVEVWRLVPDDDPNTADPNDPNMKNYFVDAITGTPYAATNPDEAALERGRDALGQAVTKDMMRFFGK